MTPPDTPVKPSASPKRNCPPAEGDVGTPPKRARTEARNTYRVPSSATTSDSSEAPPVIDADPIPADAAPSAKTIFSTSLIATPARRATITIATVRTDDVRARKHYYQDGNVLVRVENTVYNLYRLRLLCNCDSFAELFTYSMDGHSPWPWGFKPPVPVYEIRGISLTDFELFLAALDNNLYMNKTPSEPDAVSLLRAAYALGCECVLTKATTRLRELWDGSRLPRPDEPVRDAEEALAAFRLARQYAVPGMLKRAVYDLLANSAFVDRFLDNPFTINLDYSDIILLQHVHLKLSRAWRDFVVVPPGLDETRIPRSCCCRTSAPAPDCDPSDGRYIRDRFPDRHRQGTWEGQVIRWGQLEAGAGNPLRYDWITLRGPELEKHWCEACREERRNAWEVKRREWWHMLDELLLLS